MYIGLHVKYRLLLSDFTETLIFSTDFRKILEYQVSRKSVQCDPRCSMRTDEHDTGNYAVSRKHLKRDLIHKSVLFRNKGQHPAVPVLAYYRFRGLQEVEASRFHEKRHRKLVRLSALRTVRLYPPGNIPCINFCQRLSRTPWPLCGRQDYVNEKFRLHHRESNPRPSGLQCSVSFNFPTACYKEIQNHNFI